MDISTYKHMDTNAFSHTCACIIYTSTQTHKNQHIFTHTRTHRGGALDTGRNIQDTDSSGCASQQCDAGVQQYTYQENFYSCWCPWIPRDTCKGVLYACTYVCIYVCTAHFYSCWCPWVQRDTCKGVLYVCKYVCICSALWGIHISMYICICMYTTFCTYMCT